MINTFPEMLSYLKLTDLHLHGNEFLFAKFKKLPKGFLIKNVNNGVVFTNKKDEAYYGTIYQLNFPFSEEQLEEILNGMVDD